MLNKTSVANKSKQCVCPSSCRLENRCVVRASPWLMQRSHTLSSRAKWEDLCPGSAYHAASREVSRHKSLGTPHRPASPEQELIVGSRFKAASPSTSPLSCPLLRELLTYPFLFLPLSGMSTRSLIAFSLNKPLINTYQGKEGCATEHPHK